MHTEWEQLVLFNESYGDIIAPTALTQCRYQGIALDDGLRQEIIETCFDSLELRWSEAPASSEGGEFDNAIMLTVRIAIDLPEAGSLFKEDGSWQVEPAIAEVRLQAFDPLFLRIPAFPGPVEFFDGEIATRVFGLPVLNLHLFLEVLVIRLGSITFVAHRDMLNTWGARPLVVKVPEVPPTLG